MLAATSVGIASIRPEAWDLHLRRHRLFHALVDEHPEPARTDGSGSLTHDTPETTRLLTVMAGFFRGASIPESTLIWVEALQSISDQLLLVFDNPAPQAIPTSWNTQHCQVLFGHHGEYDFGSYKRGLQRAEHPNRLDSATHVLFCNDSVYGPITDLATVIAPMLERSDQAWGLTESHQLTPHLQSFFLLLGASVLQCLGSAVCSMRFSDNPTVRR